MPSSSKMHAYHPFTRKRATHSLRIFLLNTLPYTRSIARHCMSDCHWVEKRYSTKHTSHRNGGWFYLEYFGDSSIKEGCHDIFLIPVTSETQRWCLTSFRISQMTKLALYSDLIGVFPTLRPNNKFKISAMYRIRIATAPTKQELELSFPINFHCHPCFNKVLKLSSNNIFDIKCPLESPLSYCFKSVVKWRVVASFVSWTLLIKAMNHFPYHINLTLVTYYVSVWAHGSKGDLDMESWLW